MYQLPHHFDTEGGSHLNTRFEYLWYSFILRLNTGFDSVLHGLLQWILRLFIELLIFSLCFWKFFMWIKFIEFFSLTQLNTPPEYPECSNRAFPLNTPGDPHSADSSNEVSANINQIILSHMKKSTRNNTSCGRHRTHVKYLIKDTGH